MKPRLIEDEHAGAGIPRREDAGIGVLGPARRGDVEVHVTGLQPQDIHRAEMPDRIALMAVLHELGFGGGAGCEVEQQRVGWARLAIRREIGGWRRQVFVTVPARHIAGADQREALGDSLELRRLGRAGDDVAHPAPLEAIQQVGLREQRAGGNDHCAELHRRQHHLPQRHHIAEHQQDAVAALHAQRAQPVGDAAGAFGQLGEGQLGGAFANDLERRAPTAFAARQLGVEPVERPVEAVQIRPAEARIRSVIIRAMRKQEIPRRLERLIGHVPTPGCPSSQRKITEKSLAPKPSSRTRL